MDIISRYLLIAIWTVGFSAPATADDTFGACTGPGASASGWLAGLQDMGGQYYLVTAGNNKKLNVEIDNCTQERSDS